MKKFTKYLIIFWVVFILLVCIMGVTRHVVLGGNKITGAPKETIIFLSTFLSNTQNMGEKSKPQLIESKIKLKNGFTYTPYYKKNKDYILVEVWDKVQEEFVVKLIRISDGKQIRKWIVDVQHLIKKYCTIIDHNESTKLNIKNAVLQHAYITENGSLIFALNGYFKFDKNSKMIWSTRILSHHSLERDSLGNFWGCATEIHSKNAEKYGMYDDFIVKVSEKTGKILYKKSVFDLLMENEYNRALLFNNTSVSPDSRLSDYIHLNDVQPVYQDSKFWKKGDLFLSLRNQNLIVLYRPSTNKILWSKCGPWLKQHDVIVIDSNQIGVFGNNALAQNFKETSKAFIDATNIEYIYDFSTDKLSTPYSYLFQSTTIRTDIQGRAEILPHGNIFVEETAGGRLLFGDQNHLKWTYIERIDENHLSTFGWCRYIPEKEFKKINFTSTKKNKKALL